MAAGDFHHHITFPGSSVEKGKMKSASFTYKMPFRQFFLTLLLHFIAWDFSNMTSLDCRGRWVFPGNNLGSVPQEKGRMVVQVGVPWNAPSPVLQGQILLRQGLTMTASETDSLIPLSPLILCAYLTFRIHLC